MGKYKEVDGKPVLCDDILEWSQWFETADRVVSKDEVLVDGETIIISTVFLGIDYSYSGEGPPLVYETIIIGGKHDQYQDRYSTRGDALIVHCMIVRQLKAGTFTS